MSKQESIRWFPNEELSKREEQICARCKRNDRIYLFFHRHRHEIFDEEFQAELAEMYSDSSTGRPPVPPALLAMVTILQAADGVSDEGAVVSGPRGLRRAPREWRLTSSARGRADAYTGATDLRSTARVSNGSRPKATAEGRAELRERVSVEHSLARICNRRGRRARYIGIEKNIFELCPYAVIEHCFAADRMEREAA